MFRSSSEFSSSPFKEEEEEQKKKQDSNVGFCTPLLPWTDCSGIVPNSTDTFNMQ